MKSQTTNEFFDIDHERYVGIRHVDRLEPFLMSVVSDSDHWLFVGSNGPFAAGRVDADHAVFPYQTVDKILRHSDTSGSLTVLQVWRDGAWVEWQPTERHLYKHVLGTGVIFEGSDPELRFRWSLTTCEPYGFVRECRLENLTGQPIRVRCLDGWHHILPPNVTQHTYVELSYLAAAYMRHEALDDSLALFALNAGISDRAEASESLRVACAWSLGQEGGVRLLTDRQVGAFRKGLPVEAETDVRGEMGAYLTAHEWVVDGVVSWVNVVDTGLDHAAVVRLQAELRDPAKLRDSLARAVQANREGLRRRIAAGDGLQDTADESASAHHFANVLFNSMRGGAFPDGYHFPTADFRSFVNVRNRKTAEKHQAWLNGLPERMSMSEVQAAAETTGDPQLERIAREYLPLTFSRRHGDPSRPWNRFNIHLKDAHGEPIYAYQGNWRDIFQNWESLALSYPFALESMVSVFLNASTADGYNPYRISREGIDWEAPDPHNPWANIGYWGDHQIIYLLRLLEALDRLTPGRLREKLGHRGYAYACVPYEIGDFERIVRNPQQTITFNRDLHNQLLDRANRLGSDGKLISNEQGEVQLVTLAEKLLVPALVKLSNLVPGGGIWLNTQRPEWNDANNALAGWGLSMVTVYYLRRYLAFLGAVFGDQEVEVTAPVAQLLRDLTTILSELDMTDLSDASRFAAMQKLGRAGAAHRAKVYQEGPTGSERVSPKALISTAIEKLEDCIRIARRPDGLYHSYNVLGLDGDSASVKHLDLMLEGQVAVLSSGVLSPEEAAGIVEALRHSPLYRPDQRSYILYPDRNLAPFLERNTLAGPPPVRDRTLFTEDDAGRWHFQADLRNVGDIRARLEALGVDDAAGQQVLDLWEQTFQHREFTGRSSTMFMFEGLGSIYWHMVAKLLVAVQECHQVSGDPRLAKSYEAVRDGLGFRKTPPEYGAFPTDPYSHTPAHRGAQQPGMTGQVKEEILTRWGELGITIDDGRLRFAPKLLSPAEFFDRPHVFPYVDVHGQSQEWEMPQGTLGFTVCQVPVCYQLSESPGLRVERTDGTSASELTETDSTAILGRQGTVRRVTVILAG